MSSDLIKFKLQSIDLLFKISSIIARRPSLFLSSKFSQLDSHLIDGRLEFLDLGGSLGFFCLVNSDLLGQVPDLVLEVDYLVFVGLYLVAVVYFALELKNIALSNFDVLFGLEKMPLKVLIKNVESVYLF